MYSRPCDFPEDRKIPPCDINAHRENYPCLVPRRERLLRTLETITEKHVNLGKRIGLMGSYGIPPKLVRMVQAMYKGSKCAVIDEGGKIDWFDI